MTLPETDSGAIQSSGTAAERIALAEARLREAQAQLAERRVTEPPASKPLGLTATQATIIVAIIGFLGSFTATYFQNAGALELKRLEMESNLIVKAVETGNSVRSRTNLRFLVEAGFLPKRQAQLEQLLRDSSKATFTLPAVSPVDADPTRATDVRGVLDTVLAVLNAKDLSIRLVLQPGFNNVASVADSAGPQIVYDPDLISQWQHNTRSRWTLAVFLAHEASHFILHHFDNPSATSLQKSELSADSVAGLALCRLGAPLADSRGVYSMMPERASEWYPTRKERVLAFDRGWKSTARGSPPTCY